MVIRSPFLHKPLHEPDHARAAPWSAVGQRHELRGTQGGPYAISPSGGHLTGLMIYLHGMDLVPAHSAGPASSSPSARPVPQVPTSRPGPIQSVGKPRSSRAAVASRPEPRASMPGRDDARHLQGLTKVPRQIPRLAFLASAAT
jgi:hypothetical protein